MFGGACGGLKRLFEEKTRFYRVKFGKFSENHICQKRQIKNTGLGVGIGKSKNAFGSDEQATMEAGDDAEEEQDSKDQDVQPDGAPDDTQPPEMDAESEGEQEDLGDVNDHREEIMEDQML